MEKNNIVEENSIVNVEEVVVEVPVSEVVEEVAPIEEAPAEVEVFVEDVVEVPVVVFVEEVFPVEEVVEEELVIKTIEDLTYSELKLFKRTGVMPK